MSNPAVPSIRNGGDSSPIPFADAEHNANLIAAAPDLFNALEAMLSASQPQAVHQVFIGEAQDLATAALRKARGEQS